MVGQVLASDFDRVRLVCVLPPDALCCFFILLGTSFELDELSDLFFRFIALVTLLSQNVIIHELINGIQREIQLVLSIYSHNSN